MRLRILISALIASCVIYVVFLLQCSNEETVLFYAKNIRNNLFAGFLTVGAFLFSLKTFIVVKMKENVYDDKNYIEKLAERRALTPNLTHYGPLKRLSHLLFASVLSSIITAIAQLTIGFFNCWATVVACIWLAVFSISLLVISLFQIKNNLDNWFEYLEKK